MDEECDGVRLPLSPLLLLFFVIASEISTWAGGRCRHVATRTRNGRDSLSSIKIPVDCHTKQINPMSLLCSRQCENIFVAQTTCENVIQLSSEVFMTLFSPSHSLTPLISQQSLVMIFNLRARESRPD